MNLGLGVMAHPYNHSYMGGRNRRIAAWSLPWKKWAIPKIKPGMEVHICNPSYIGGRSRRIVVQGQPTQSTRPYLEKHTKVKKAGGGVAQVLEHLLTKCKALSSNPVLPEKKKRGTQTWDSWPMPFLLSFYSMSNSVLMLDREEWDIMNT
jgi:hypothetical protein